MYRLPSQRVLCLLFSVLLTTQALQGQKIPQPADGEWVNATLALLRYSRDLCQDLGGEVRQNWRQREATDEKGIQEMVLHRGMSNLASARASGDLVRQLIDGARREAGFETGASLERLRDLLTTLCDTVALPAGPRGNFEKRLADLAEKIALEEERLGRIVVIDETRLQGSIEPYLTHIQLAGVQAEGEFLAYLESLRKEPEPPTLTELMVAWHRGYAQGVAPTKDALRYFLSSRKKGNVQEIGQSCRRLIAVVMPLLEDDELFLAPDQRVRKPLRDAYLDMRRAASDCARGRFDQVDKHLSAMQQDLQRAARRLGPHGLQP